MFITGVNNTGDNPCHEFSVIAGVVDIADEHAFANISEKFRKNLKRSSSDTQGPGGKLIHENNLKLKISCQTPFNG
jgi:hypothetical protein